MKNSDKSQNIHGAVIVTGASSGIGLAICKALLNDGFTVYGLSRTIDKSGLSHERFNPVSIDLAESDQIAPRLSELLKSLDLPLRALINNVGVGKMGFLEQLSSADIQHTINLNFVSHALVSKSVLPVMKQQLDLADIVFIGSEAALQGAQQGSVYCASKFALRGFAQALRQECAKSSTRITLINPGAVRTDFFDELSFEPGDSSDNAIEPQDVAAVVLEVLRMRAGTVIDEVNMTPMKKVWQSKNPTNTSS